MDEESVRVRNAIGELHQEFRTVNDDIVEESELGGEA
jgi:hypothetical protein